MTIIVRLLSLISFSYTAVYADSLSTVILAKCPKESIGDYQAETTLVGHSDVPVFYRISNASAQPVDYLFSSRLLGDLTFTPSNDYQIKQVQLSGAVDINTFSIPGGGSKVFYFELTNFLTFPPDKDITVELTWNSEKWALTVRQNQVVDCKDLGPAPKRIIENLPMTTTLTIACPPEDGAQYEEQKKIVGTNEIPVFCIVKSTSSNSQPFPVNSTSLRPHILPGDHYTIIATSHIPHGPFFSTLEPAETKLLYFDLAQFAKLDNSKNITVEFLMGPIPSKYKIELVDGKAENLTDITSP
jgi:hypothetical protein